MPEALLSSELIIGWARAAGLLDSTISWENFRKIVRIAYYCDQPDLRKAGAAAGHLWRFVREMKSDDLVVVPHGGEFFVAKVAGPPTYGLKKLTTALPIGDQCNGLTQEGLFHAKSRDRL